MTYPSLIQIETSGTCNAHCSFCPHSTMNRTAKDRMSDEVFTKIIDELASWSVHPPHICPFLTNEPFADARIYRFCYEINLKLPKTGIALFTNGSMFTESNLNKLAIIRNIEFVHVSLHHSNKEDYERDLGINWENTLASVHRLIDAKKWNVRLGRVQSGHVKDDERFLEFCAKEFPGTEACLSYRYNWKGDIASTFDYRSTLDIICPRQSGMTILCDGRVALCCMDENGDYSLGDVNTQTLEQIYNSKAAIDYRTKTKRNLTPCDKCNMRA